MELDQRKLRILRAVVDEYILTAGPVGSKSLSKNKELNWSPATIRSEMSELEELGYLEQPHTSAGRVPSDKAYRLYVDSMLEAAKLSRDEINYMQSYAQNSLSGVEAVVRETAKALSRLTRYPAAVLMPQISLNHLKHVQLVPLSEGRVLMVLVSKAGVAKNSVLRVPKELSITELERLSRLITEVCRDCTMHEAPYRLLAELGEMFSDKRNVLNALMDGFRAGLDADSRAVELAGTTSMLRYPEYSDLDKAKNFLAAVEDKGVLADMLRKASELEFTITIGNENEPDELKDCSVVTASYKVNGKPIGSFGIIGPTRMDYAKVISVLGYMRSSVSEVLMNILKED